MYLERQCLNPSTWSTCLGTMLVTSCFKSGESHPVHCSPWWVQAFLPLGEYVYIRRPLSSLAVISRSGWTWGTLGLATSTIRGANLGSSDHDDTCCRHQNAIYAKSVEYHRCNGVKHASLGDKWNESRGVLGYVSALISLMNSASIRAWLGCTITRPKLANHGWCTIVRASPAARLQEPVPLFM